MRGMPSPADMQALEQQNGAEFDRKFIDLMVAHHRAPSIWPKMRS